MNTKTPDIDNLRTRLARLRIAVDVWEALPAWTITIQLMGNDIGPDDDEVSVKRKLNLAANKLTLFTGAKDLSWGIQPEPWFSFRLYMPGTPNPRTQVKIVLRNETYTVTTAMSPSGKMIKTVSGIYSERLRKTVEEMTGLYLSTRR